jgi:hypothetical protein
VVPTLDENLWATPLPGSAGGSAKKRWLRQAISEETETESPVGPGGGVPVNASEVLDHVTPLKKRRLARASLSSETSFTPPSTPTPSHAIGTGDSVDKDEPNVDLSMSAENSQGTPPEYDDVDMDTDKRTADVASVSPNGFNHEPPPPPLPSWTKGSSSFASPVVPNDDTMRPTWEFRAPDAQFMRSRNASEVSDTAPLDTTQSASGDEQQRKPPKRKLSILEYRQRKQNVPGDGAESTESPARTKSGSTLSDSDNLPSERKPSDLFSEVTADESNTDLSTDGD